MKEQILTLERSDDVHSLHDKIVRAQASRLLLVWPALETPPLRRVDLALIRRWAAMAGAEIAVVSPDPAVGKLAKQAGIVCHPSLTKAALAALKPRPEALRKPTRPSIRISPIQPPERLPSAPLANRIRFPLFAAALALPILALGLSVPAAVIRATFPARDVSLSIVLPVDACTVLRSTIVLTERRSATGRSRVPVSFAGGTAVITNTSSQGLNLPAGLRLSTLKGIQFSTTQGKVIAPGRSETIPVRAVDPGPTGNILRGELSQVDGPLALSLKVDNPQSYSGGEEDWRTAVTQADLESLHSGLAARMQTEAEVRMHTLAGSSLLLVKDSVQWEELSSGGPEYPAQTAVETVAWTLDAEATGLACPAAGFLAQAQTGLTAELVPGETLRAGSIQMELRALASGEILLTASGKAAAFPSERELAAAIRCQTSARASAILTQQFHAVEPPQIDVFPAWFPLLPPYPFRMELLAEVD